MVTSPNVVPAAPVPTLVVAGKFLPAPVTNLATTWTNDLADFEQLISPAVNPKGLDEESLLKWFGASIHRMALIPFALTGIPPTHVARELTIGRFRVDFAWASIQPGMKPSFGFIELQDASEDTLFRVGTRAVPYIGRSFLDGFSQLVDWCCFGQNEVKTNSTISSLVVEHQHAYQTVYQYALIAGLDRFAQDPFNSQRLVWWNDHIKLGAGTDTKTFTGLWLEAKERLKYLRDF